ncbi:MAG: hypothetical protein ACR2PX_27065, partial [Endozoicomonas sp.]|uniref:hypothetical protein n=1 Tax=Endozoicomonas sp. TaxID=1892382 RepID=UPI003D9ACBA2
LPVKLMFFRIRENSLTASQENPAKLYDERCSTCALKFLYIEVDGYRPGRGDIRRPDLVIVADSSKPPSKDNIDQVVEFKFGQDKRDPFQDSAYENIAGKRNKYSIYRVGGPRKDREQGCNCQNPIQSAV